MLIAVLGLAGGCILLNIALSLAGGGFSIQLPVEHKNMFSADAAARFPSRLYARGSRIVDADGSTILLKGLMPADPARLRSKGKFDQEFFSEMAATGANVIRIPVHPGRWVRDEDYLWRYLDPVVAWAGESDTYVMIDWHYIGNVATGAGPEMPDIDAQPKDLTLEFWRVTARYFRDAPNVAFEIFNEPQSIGAEEWRANAMEIIRAIREQGASQLVIVGGIDYGKDLSWAVQAPIDDPNVVYASHIYPAHPSTSWPYWFGSVAEEYPVLVTEWGFMDENGDPSASYLAGDQTTYGDPLLEYLNARSIGWVACWYDDKWLPPMFTEGWKSRTRYGQFVLQQLNGAQ